MATYFVTGATGFLGRRLVDRLLDRPGCGAVHVLVRARFLRKLPVHRQALNLADRPTG